MTRRIAIIPARAGSKRLPGKNVRPFMGKPLIQYSIEAALESKLFDTILVTTNDPKARSIAEGCGVLVHDRPLELATDTASVNQTLLFTLNTLEQQGEHYDELCCLYATAPLRTAADIALSQRLLKPGSTDFVIAVTRYLHSPYQALVASPDGHLSLMWPIEGNVQQQKLPRPLVDNGSTYWASVTAFKSVRTFYASNMIGFEMPISRSIDIDTSDDLSLATMFSPENKLYGA